MSYIDPQMAQKVLCRMAEFHSDQVQLHQKHGMDFLDNLGRRNAIMSRAQEQFLSEELNQIFTDVRYDGRSGYPDIVIGQLGSEIECKLTSPNGCGTVVLQSDYKFLEKKQQMDFVYIVADRDFEKFCFLHFKGLTTADFKVPYKSAKGKGTMLMKNAMIKCHVIHGAADDRAAVKIWKLKQQIQAVDADYQNKIEDKRHEVNQLATQSKMNYRNRLRYKAAAAAMDERLPARWDKARNRLLDKLQQLEKAQGSSFEFRLESLS